MLHRLVRGFVDEDGLADVAKVLRPTDGVLIGMYPPDRSDIVADNVRRIAQLTAT